MTGGGWYDPALIFYFFNLPQINPFLTFNLLVFNVFFSPECWKDWFLSMSYTLTFFFENNPNHDGGGDDKSLPFQLLICWSLMFTLVQSAEKIDFCLWQKFIFIITIGGGGWYDPFNPDQKRN